MELAPLCFLRYVISHDTPNTTVAGGVDAEILAFHSTRPDINPACGWSVGNQLVCLLRRRENFRLLLLGHYGKDNGGAKHGGWLAAAGLWQGKIATER